MSDPNEHDFRWPAGKRGAVSLSFDDARPSQVDRGMAVLDSAGAKATFYVSVRAVQQRRAAWQAAVAAGHEIGNHTMSHPCSGNFPFARDRPLEAYTLEQMEAELTDANQAVRDLLGITPVTFAYPCGQTFVGRGPAVRSYVPLVARHFSVGRAAFNETHNAPGFCDLAQLFSRDADGKGFEELRAMVDAAAAEGGWLILMGHDVGEGLGRRQVTHDESLARLCEHCLDPASGIWLDTVAAVGEHVRRARER